MGKKCNICGKKPQVGNNVSHANNRSKRRFNPNLHTIRIALPSGQITHVTVCTRCVRSGTVVKPGIIKKDAK